MLDVLTPKQQKAINALLTEANMQAAARVAGVNPLTLHRWLRQAPFMRALNEAQTGALGDSVRRLTIATQCGIDLLLEVIQDKAQPAAVRIRAAEIVMRQLPEMAMLGDIKRRLDQLEGRNVGGNTTYR